MEIRLRAARCRRRSSDLRDRPCGPPHASEQPEHERSAFQPPLQWSSRSPARGALPEMRAEKLPPRRVAERAFALV